MRNNIIKTINKNDIKRFEDTLAKVITKMSEKHKDLLPKLFGMSNNIGIPGTQKQQGNGDGKKLYDEIKNQKYNLNGDPNGAKVLFGGGGTCGTGTGTGVRIGTDTTPGPHKTRGIEEGGTHTVLVERKSTNNTNTNIVPPVKTKFTDRGDAPPLTVEFFPEAIYETVNTATAAGRALKTNQQLYEKTVVAAAYRTTHPNISVSEYCELVDGLWNEMC